jgi:hypothetical protein
MSFLQVMPTVAAVPGIRSGGTVDAAARRVHSGRSWSWRFR